MICWCSVCIGQEQASGGFDIVVQKDSWKINRQNANNYQEIIKVATAALNSRLFRFTHLLYHIRLTFPIAVVLNGILP